MMETFWDQVHVIPSGETRFWHLGPLRLWVRRLPGEWQVAHLSEGGEEAGDLQWILGQPNDSIPVEANMRRFTFNPNGEADYLILKPMMPDRAIVSRPTSPLEVPRGGTAEIVCGVPLWLEVYGGTESAPLMLTSIPIKSLSKTWFGTAQEGEPCYASATQAVCEFTQLPPNALRVLCPVTITNSTSETLPIDRICIRVAHLAIYQGVNYLWSNRMKVSKTAVHATSRITFGSRAPRLEPDAKLIRLAREKVSKGGLIGQTFNHLKSFLGD